MKKIYEYPHIEVVHVKVESLMLSPSKFDATRYDGKPLEDSHELSGDIKEWEGDTFDAPAKRGNMSNWDWDVNWE